jgi:hypothetical protein
LPFPEYGTVLALTNISDFFSVPGRRLGEDQRIPKKSIGFRWIERMDDYVQIVFHYEQGAAFPDGRDPRP